VRSAMSTTPPSDVEMSTEISLSPCHSDPRQMEATRTPDPEGVAVPDEKLQEEPFTTQRFVGFLLLHVIGFGSLVSAVVNFWYTGDKWFMWCLLMPLMFSGFFCTYAAWNFGTPGSEGNCRILPLKQWNYITGILLMIPYGFFQGVIISLACSEFTHRKSTSTSSHGGAVGRARTSKFECKAVSGVFEGILSAAVILYAFWGISYPSEKEQITIPQWDLEKRYLAVVGVVSFFSAGLGLIEVDTLSSPKLAGRMRASILSEFLHLMFRVCEVISRISLFTFFQIIMRKKLGMFSFMPLLVDVVLTLGLVTIHGGSETSISLRVLCALPCTFSNIFLFIDSPTKTHAARSLSKRLHAKNLAGLLILPLVAYLADDEAWNNLMLLVRLHNISPISSLVSIPLYWVLLYCVLRDRGDDTGDIFCACMDGDKEAVDRMMRGAVRFEIDCLDVNGKTPLMLAAQKGHSDICKVLIKEGAKVSFKTTYDPLRFSIVRCCTTVKPCWTAPYERGQGARGGDQGAHRQQPPGLPEGDAGRGRLRLELAPFVPEGFYVPGRSFSYVRS